MNLLQELFATGRIADLILLLVALEAAALLLLHNLTGRGVPARQLLSNLAAGATLVLALRSVLLDQPWSTTAMWLLAALIAHAADLLARWR